MLLEDIAQIFIGIVLRRKEAEYKTTDSYEYQVFNLRSYEEDFDYDLFHSKENLEEFVAKKGDILFRLSYPMKVIEVNEEIEGKLVNNQYCIIRINNKNYTSSFLKCFLQSDMAKRQFEKNLIGSTIKSLPVSDLRRLIIPKINLEKQEKLSKLLNIWNKEKYLYKKIIKVKDKYYNSIINKLISGGID